jgi:hypothetical protein
MFLRFLAAALASVALLVVAPTPAQAATGINCDRYLETGYGPVGQCTQDTGAYGRAGMYSPLTRTFSPTTGFLRFTTPYGRNYFVNGAVLATDGVVAFTRGYGEFETAFGPGIYATQSRGGQGRWGVWNRYTARFYPSSGWFPVCCLAS